MSGFGMPSENGTNLSGFGMPFENRTNLSGFGMHSKSGHICPDFECFLSPSLDRFIKKRNILFMPKRSSFYHSKSGQICPVFEC